MRKRNITILMVFALCVTVAFVAVAGTIQWDKDRLSVGNLICGNLTVKEELDADGGGDIAGGLTIGDGTSISNMYWATQDATTSVTAVTIPGVRTGDAVFVTKNTAIAQTINGAESTTDTVTVTLSDDPSTTCTLAIGVLR